ncbi:MAG: aminopeptidase [Anaerolineae bacterium]|nr:aminopeptidase [Anaerolineae bacterium]
MDLAKQVTQAIETIFSNCLSLPAGAEIIIFGDETTLETTTLLAEVAVSMGFHPILTYFTIQMQKTLGDNHLPHTLENILNDTTSTLICLNGSPDCLSFRDNLRQAALNLGAKVAHMPGISLNTLLLADVDYQTLTTECEMLALALAKGRKIEIISTDRSGNEYSLNVPLCPWVRLPIISDAVIQPGSWGNVPSGETYIAPIENAATGTIVINGSLPGYLIGQDDEIILRFEKGNLVEWRPTGSPAVQHLQQTQIEFAKSQGDQNWRNLAEIGFGVNPRVQKLTGNPLLDEKKYGTVHIAIGDNIDMGGDVQSQIHCDMVCLSPRVKIDNKSLLHDGRITLEDSDWREDYRKINAPKAWHIDINIKCTAADTRISDQGCLYRLWDTSAGRICSVPVGNNETTRILAGIYQFLQQKVDQPMPLRDLAKQKKEFSLEQILQLTYLLRQYGLVNKV